MSEGRDLRMVPVQGEHLYRYRGGPLLRNSRREEPLLQRQSLGSGLLGIGRTWEEFGREGARLSLINSTLQRKKLLEFRA